MKEKWKKVKGFENYLVSNLGRVWSRKRKVKGRKNQMVPIRGGFKTRSLTNGYERVCLSRKGKQKTFYVHRLVAQAFIPNPNNKPDINHIDGTRTNNIVPNLEWCTPKENTLHGVKMGRFQQKLNPAKVKEIIKRLNTGEIPTHIAKDYGVCPVLVMKIRDKKVWKHITKV